jgi:hypothetical protein
MPPSPAILAQMAKRLAAAAVILVFCACAASAAAFSAPDFLQKLRAQVVAQNQRDDHDVADSQQLLTRAKAAYDAAVASHDAPNSDIARQAIDTAQKALEVAKASRELDRQRLNAINRAAAWPDPGKSFAVPMLVRGTVVKKTSSGDVPFDPNAPMLPGDTVDVGPNSSLELQFSDGSQIKLGHDTLFSYESDDTGSLYRLLRGVLKSQRHCSPTPTAVMGVLGCNGQPRYQTLQYVGAVRGTEFIMQANDEGAAIAVFEGWVEIDPGNGADKIAVKEGQKLFLPKSGAPGQPVPLQPNGSPKQ